MNATAMKDEVVGKVADTATEVISNAAGAVADPRTGLKKARGFAGRQKLPLAVGAMVIVLLVLLVRRTRG